MKGGQSRKRFMVQSKMFLKFNKIQHYFFDKYDYGKIPEYKEVMDKCISAGQVHSNKVIFIYGRKRKYQNCDGLVTDRNVYLGIETADCLPVLLYDPMVKIIGAVHAGWKGLLSGILVNAVNCMQKQGARTANIFVAVGPHISACCYKTSAKMVKQFQEKFGNIAGAEKNRHSEWYLDLAQIALWQLTHLGLPGKNIEILKECTFCNRQYFSYRRDGTACGRIWSVIGVKS